MSIDYTFSLSDTCGTRDTTTNSVFGGFVQGFHALRTGLGTNNSPAFSVKFGGLTQKDLVHAEVPCLPSDRKGNEAWKMMEYTNAKLKSVRRRS